MLVLDTTVWGGIMVLAGVPVLSTAIMIFLFVLVVLFADGYWRLGLLAATAMWFTLSGFTSEAAPLTLGHVLGVLLIAGGLAALIARVRGWLGRLDAGRSQMLGTVSHELRNNLTGVMGLTQIVGTDPDLTHARTKELVALAHQQAVDASEIVEDLLTVTRLEHSALSVTPVSVDINQEVETTARRFSGAGTRLVVKADPATPAAAADALRVRQVLRNLVSNAVRYGGPSIRISTHFDGTGIEVTVADDGEGVPKEDEASIFLPYRRSTRSHAESVGLGLWASRQLAIAMGGSLEYRRVEGWTEFVFSLPARASETQQSPVFSDPSPKSSDVGFPDDLDLRR
jgi:signal transduction histidine kinase